MNNIDKAKKMICKNIKLNEIGKECDLSSKEIQNIKKDIVIEILENNSLIKALDKLSTISKIYFRDVINIAKEINMDLDKMKKLEVVRIFKSKSNKKQDIYAIARRVNFDVETVLEIRDEEVYKPYIEMYYPKNAKANINEIARKLKTTSEIIDGVLMDVKSNEIITGSETENIKSENFIKAQKRIEELKKKGFMIENRYYKFIEEYPAFLLFESERGVKETVSKNSILAGEERNNIAVKPRMEIKFL